MAKKQYQFRYYGNNKTDNYPSGISLSSLQSGEIFLQYYPISYLKITTNVSGGFYLNGGLNIIYPYTKNSNKEYELNTYDLAKIIEMSIDKTLLNNVNNTNNGKLIIDIIYDK